MNVSDDASNPLPSHMVAQRGLEPPGIADATSAANLSFAKPDSALLTTTALRDGTSYPIEKWAPRSGRTTQYYRWYSGLCKLLAALGVQESFLYSTPPPQPNTITGVAAQKAARLEREHWQTISTALYWHVLPSIVLDDLHWKRDNAYLDTLYSQHLADGISLVRWALKFVDLTSKDVQFKLKQKLASVKLSAGSTCAQLEQHATQLFELWSLILNNDPNNAVCLDDYYEILLHSLPAQPEGAHLTSARTWFAGKVIEFKHTRANELMSVLGTDGKHGAIDSLVAYARTLGLPKGDAASAAKGMLHLVFNGSDVMFSDECPECDDADGDDATLLALRGGPPGGPPSRAACLS